MYFRGGKVWIGQKAQGLVFLEKDWKHDRLPEDLVEEAGLLGTNFKLLDKTSRAKLGGYSIFENFVKFVVDPSSVRGMGEDPKIFLASEFNHWLKDNKDSDKWLLKKDNDNNLSLSIDCQELPFASQFSFKFKTLDGLWLNPPDFLPCTEESTPGATNYLFNNERSGADILEFQIIESENPSFLTNWTTHRCENLGANILGSLATFRLFAPHARNVTLQLGENFAKNGMLRKLPMTLHKDGVWEAITKVEHDDLVYLYEIEHSIGNGPANPFKKRVLDPYARGSLSREGPGLIRKSQNKPSHEADQFFLAPEPKDLVIMEAHIRDLLKKAPISLSSSERLEFRGLTKWLRQENCYLRQIGVNAVELQPIYQFDAKSKEEYHWGYMPVNFFSPSSEYASQPHLAEEEFKEMVLALHDAKIAVILDVVYNHVGIPNHLLNIDRELYLMTDELGRLTNHSGCGNDLRCDAEPVKQLIIDSLKHWVKNYNVDGFRFDLAELLGIDLLMEIERELRAINPRIILIAEPWSFRGRLPTCANETCYSLWSDRCRESLLTFVTKGTEKDQILLLMQGKLDMENLLPWQSIQYVESHDDYSFIDRICSNSKNGGTDPSDLEVFQAKLAMVILLLSPGIPMLSAGQDFLRSKQGVRNTYQEEEINALDYNRLSRYADLHKELREIIRFRLSDRGTFTRPASFDDCFYYEDPHLQSSEIIHLVIRHRKSPEEFLFLCNPTNSCVAIDLNAEWKKREVIFPMSSRGHVFNSIKPYCYLLLVRKNSQVL